MINMLTLLRTSVPTMEENKMSEREKGQEEFLQGKTRVPRWTHGF